MKGIRKAIIIPLFFILLFSVVPTYSQNGTLAELKLITNLDNNIGFYGDVFTVSIIVKADEVKFVQCRIKFNNTLLRALAVENGEMFDNITIVPGTGIENETGIDNENGLVGDIFSYAFEPINASNGLIFANITFQVIGNKSAITTIDFVEDYCFVLSEDITYEIAFQNVTITLNPVDIEIQPQQISIGNYTENLYIEVKPNGNEIIALNCTLVYEPEYVDINVLQGEGIDFLWFSTSSYDGKIDIITAINTSNPITTNATFAIIEVTPKQSGITSLNLTKITVVGLDDGYYKLIYMTKNATLDLDIDAPDISFEVGTPYYNDWVATATPIYINATDAHNYTIYYRIWNGSWQEWQAFNENVELHLQDEGLHYIEYYAIDELNNRNPINGTYNVTLYVDNSSPVVLIANGAPFYNEYITSSTPIYINATDEGAGIKEICYRIDEGGIQIIPGVEHIMFTLQDEGEHIIEYWAVDNLENEAEHQTVTYKVDNSPPSTDINANPSQPDGANNWYVTDIIVNLTAVDEGVGTKEIYYSIDTQDNFEEYIGNITLSQEGEHTLYYYAEDNLGNKEEIKEFTYKLDKTAPSITITSGPSGKVETSTVTFSWSGSDNIGIYGFYYRVDGGSWIGPTSETSKSFTLADGDHTFEVKAVDEAGNYKIASRSFTIETNKPPVAEFTYTPSQPKDIDDITFNASDSYDPEGGSLNYTWDFGDGNISYGKIVVHKYADNGTYTVKLIVRDDKGATDEAIQQIIVANAPPSKPVITYEPAKPKVNEEIKFTGMATDEDGSIVNYTWDFGDGNISYGKEVTHIYTKKGNYTVKLTVRDNDGAEAERIIYVKVIKPEVTVWPYILILIILIIIAIVVVAVWKKRQSGK